MRDETPYRIVPLPEVAARTGLSVELLTDIRTSIIRLLNDTDLRRRVEVQYRAGRLSTEAGLQWYMDAKE